MTHEQGRWAQPPHSPAHQRQLWAVARATAPATHRYQPQQVVKQPTDCPIPQVTHSICGHIGYTCVRHDAKLHNPHHPDVTLDTSCRTRVQAHVHSVNWRDKQPNMHPSSDVVLQQQATTLTHCAQKQQMCCERHKQHQNSYCHGTGVNVTKHQQQHCLYPFYNEFQHAAHPNVPSNAPNVH